jgi:hypothetical protein
MRAHHARDVGGRVQRSAVGLLTATVIAAAIGAGCAASDGTHANTLREYERSFDPSKYRGALPEPSGGTVDTLGGVRTQAEASQPKRDRPAQVDRVVESVMGFRVQLYSSADLDDVSVQREDLRMRLTQNNIDAGEVDMTFDAPYYKLRVGSFTTKAEADALRRTLIDAGFPEAWVVRDRVRTTVR